MHPSNPLKGNGKGNGLDEAPDDYLMFRELLTRSGTPTGTAAIGHGPRRVLVSPIPSLATHAQANALAPLVDWRVELAVCPSAVLFF